MKKSIRLQQHEEIERLNKELNNMKEHLDSLYMAFYLVSRSDEPIDQAIVNAYKLGLEYADAKHSGKLYG